MSASPAAFTAESITPNPGNMPPVSLEHIAQAEAFQQQVGRRKVLKAAGMTAIIGMLAATPLGKLDRFVANALEGSDDLYIGPIPAARNLPLGGPELVVHGGIGQQSSQPAAEEIFEQLNKAIVINFVRYPSGRFTAANMAQGYRRLIREREMKNIALVGGSAGGPIAVRSFNALQRQQAYLSEQGHVQQLVEMPEQSLLSLDCAPGSLYDAFNGELAILVGRVGERLNIEPELVSKMFFSMIDGPGDTSKAMQFTNPEIFWPHFVDSVREVFNDTPEAMWWSQLVDFLLDFDIENQSPFYAPTLPKHMQKLYLLPSDFDPIVDRNVAPNRWDNGALRIDIPPFERHSVGATGHYYTPEQGVILGKLINSGVVPLAIAS